MYQSKLKITHSPKLQRQNIVKSHKKNTSKIHIPPENGLLSVSYPKDRIHEERSVSPQPPQPIQNTGFIANYPERLDRQISEKGEVVRYAGPTKLPVVESQGRKKHSKTPYNYADPKDH